MNLTLTNWNSTNYQEYITYLLSIQDVKYRKFHQKLLKENINLIGIRTPILKKLASDIYQGNYKSFLEQVKFNYYEETIIYGFILCKIKDVNELLHHLDIYTKHINNWATCDLLVTNLKIVSKNKDIFIKYIKSNITSTNPWQIRFCYVLLLSYFIEDKYIKQILNYCNKNKLDNYYVKMSIAWAISMCYIKYKDITLNYLLKENTLDKWTYNKAIQKIIESTRITKEEKNYLKSIKK